MYCLYTYSISIFGIHIGIPCLEKENPRKILNDHLDTSNFVAVFWPPGLQSSPCSTALCLSLWSWPSLVPWDEKGSKGDQEIIHYTKGWSLITMNVKLLIIPGTTSCAKRYINKWKVSTVSTVDLRVYKHKRWKSSGWDTTVRFPRADFTPVPAN